MGCYGNLHHCGKCAGALCKTSGMPVGVADLVNPSTKNRNNSIATETIELMIVFKKGYKNDSQ